MSGTLARAHARDEKRHAMPAAYRAALRPDWAQLAKRASSVAQRLEASRYAAAHAACKCVKSMEPTGIGPVTLCLQDGVAGPLDGLIFGHVRASSSVLLGTEFAW